MDKSILILGAGIYQVPLIRRAQARGYRAVVASIPGNYPGFALADRVYYTDTTDKEEILKIAEAEQVCAVTTTGTDVAVGSIGYVCRRLGLAGIGEEAARGKGLGSEVARIFTDFGFNELKLHRISLRLLADNTQAEKSYANGGFRREGLFRDMVRLDGKYRDVLFMAKLNGEDEA